MLPLNRFALSRSRRRKSASRAPHRDRAKLWHRSLFVETLEDRLVLAQFFDLGDLRISADDFHTVGNDHTATGQVAVGLKPTSGEQFTPLINIDASLASGLVAFTTDTATPRFTVTNAKIESIIQSGPSLPLWQTTAAFTFDVHALTSSGVPLTSGALPFATDEGEFTLNNIRFADPTGGATTDAQLKLQGSLGNAPMLVGLNMSVTGDNFLEVDHNGLTLTGVDEAVSGGLSVGGLGFSVSDLAISYSSGDFSLTGATSFTLENESVTADFKGAGLVVSEGVIENFDLALTSNLNVGGVSFTTNNLQVNYTANTSTYIVTGGASLSFEGQSLAVTFGGGGSDGLVITDGTLEQLDVSFVGSFKLLELEVDAGTQANPLRITYDRAQTLFTLAGQLSVPELFDATVILGTATQPGITIENGKFKLDDVTISLSDVPLGAFTLDELKVVYTETMFTVTVDVWFPEGWKLKGIVGFTDSGELDTLGFGLSGNEGIEIADSGIMITGISGEVQNLDRPEELIVSGSLTAVWGTGQLITVTGGFKVDKDELVLDADVSVLDGLSKGTGRVVLDWGDQDYSIDVQLSWYDGMFTFQAVIDISSGGDDLYVKAKADVNIPDAIPFIGGKTLADLDFVLEWHAGDLSNSFVAAWTDINLLITKIDIGIKVTFDGDVSRIGSSTIHHIESPPPSTEPQLWHYTIPFSVPQGATQATLHVDWNQTGGNQSVAVVLPDHTTIDQTQFQVSANGLAYVPQLSSSETFGIGMVNHNGAYEALTAGEYELVLTSNVKFDTAPVLTAAYGYSPPTIAVGALPSNPTSLTLKVPLSGMVDNTLGPNARATLYFDNDDAGYNGTPIAGANNLPINVASDGSWTVEGDWNMDGLLPLPHYVYASINDGVNGTTHSDYSTPVTPAPPLSGTVTNPKNHQALSGFTVYVDTDNDGRFNPSSDPYTSTGVTGFYSFGSSQLPLNSQFYVGVVVPNGYQVNPGSSSSYPVTYDGTNPLVLSFEVDEFTAIHGNVFAEFSSGHTPLSAWTLYLDANGNGSLDAGESTTLSDSSGNYAFHNVTPSTTQTVRVLVPSGYYLTGSTPGTYTVNVGPGEFTVYENNDFAVLPFSTVGGNVGGYELNNGVLNPFETGMAGWTIRRSSQSGVDAGGGLASPYATDYGFSGGQVAPIFPHEINTALVTDAAPQQVYQTNRYGSDFSYTIADLAPNAPYAVRLDFAETYWDDPGDRIFQVMINGEVVLDKFDIFAAAQADGNSKNGKAIAVARVFDAVADANGQIVLRFVGQTDNAQINGIVVTSKQAGTAVDAGGGAAGSYSSDQGFSGGTDAPSFTSAINTSNVTNPAPQEVYQTNRYGTDFSYTMGGLAADAPYAVRLHFAETYWDDPGDRLFRVMINGQVVLDKFDIFAAAQQASNSEHGKGIAVTRLFGAIANADGQIVLRFVGQTDNAQINGIEIIGGMGETTTDAAGNYAFVGLRAGTHTITEVVPNGWRGVEPFASDLQLWRHDTMHLPGNSFPRPNGVAAGDFNRDGWIDFIVNEPANDNAWKYVNINGNFTVQFEGELSYTNPIAMVAGDVVGSGTSNVATLYAEGSVYPVTVDNTEWVLTGRAIEERSGGRFTDLVVGSFGGGANMATLFIGEFESAIVTLLSDGQYKVIASDFSPRESLTTGDVNGDGFVDFIVGSSTESPLIFYGNGSGGVSGSQTIDVLPAGKVVVAGDINSDGLLDVGVYDQDALFHYALQNQTGGFAFYDTKVGELGHLVPSAYLRDMNGDLRPDLVWVSEGVVGSNSLFVALNTGEANNWFTPAQQTAWSLSPNGVGNLAMVLADLNNDGLLEAIVTDSSTGNVTVVHNTSTSVQTPIDVWVEGSRSIANDFTNAQVGQINGRAFEDVTGDGIALPAKPARAGMTVYVDFNGNGLFDAGEPSSVTGPHGLYAFDGLPDGKYRVHTLSEVGRRLSTPPAGFHEVIVDSSLGPVNDKHFGSVISRDLVLEMPAGADEWTLLRNGDRLEAIDATLGVVASHPLAEIHSLTIVGSPEPDRLTVDMMTGGFFKLPGSVTFDANGGQSDSLRFLLGNGDNAASISGQQVMINAGLLVHYTGVEQLEVTTGVGDDRLEVMGVPDVARIDLDGGAGNDVYALSMHEADVRIVDSAGTDTLDFSQAIAGVRIELARRDRQQIDVLANFLQLQDPIENVIGSSLADVIIGDQGNNLLRGGGGDDELDGTGGDDILIGDAGYDMLRGGAGRDLLIGGADADVLLGDQGDDILIAGVTKFDGQHSTLLVLMAEWTSSRTFSERVNNLFDGTGSQDRANGDFFLNADTAFDDRVPDTIRGGAGRDWALHAANDWQLDAVEKSTITESKLLGDFNHDGRVDAVDLSVWKEDYGAGGMGGRDFLTWQRNVSVVETPLAPAAALRDNPPADSSATTPAGRENRILAVVRSQTGSAAELADLAVSIEINRENVAANTSGPISHAAALEPRVIDEALTYRRQSARHVNHLVGNRHGFAALAAARENLLQPPDLAVTESPEETSDSLAASLEEAWKWVSTEKLSLRRLVR